MKPASGLIGFALVFFAFSGCGGESVSGDRDRDETSGASGDGAERGGKGGASVGTGGSPTPRGGTSSGRGGTSAATGGNNTGGTTMPGTGGSFSGTGGGAGAAGSPARCTQTIVASEANNYSLFTALVFPPVTVRPDAELRFRWSSVTEDLLGHALDARSSIDAAHVMLWKASLPNFQAMLHDNALAARDLAFVLTVYTEKMLTEASLFQFTSVGVPVPAEDILPFFNAESYPPDQHVYTLMIATGEEIGKGTRLIQSFTLDPASTNTLVEMTNDSTLIQYGVELELLERTLVPLGIPDITIDWTNLTVSARREVFYPQDITEIVVARYDETPAELENRFLDLELIAEEMWRGEVTSGSTASLSELTDGDGRPFTGVTANGTWIVALICGNCLNPAPHYLHIFEPCPLL
jgi:hypothetical protein